jgi:hypothetical protein
VVESRWANLQRKTLSIATSASEHLVDQVNQTPTEGCRSMRP